MTTTRPTFDHGDPGTPEPLWLAHPSWETRPCLDVGALVAERPRVVVLAAHPDDETLGVGALLAALSDAGADLLVLVATAGEGSHPAAGEDVRRVLGPLRRAEVERAASLLAPGARVEHLGLPDGSLANRGDALEREVTSRAGPRTLLVAPWTDDGHPDHDALGAAAQRAGAASGAAVVHYPIWLWHWASPDELPWRHVVLVEPSADELHRKRAALEEFPSQTGSWGPLPGREPVVTPPVLARARRVVEVLLDLDGVLPTLEPATEPTRGAARRAALDAMYAEGPDPWSLTGSFYEDRRRHLLLAALGRPHYGRVLEIGCADGALTRELASRCDELVALDTSEPAVAAAGEAVPTATVLHVAAPHGIPDGPFDLVVLAEVGYFLSPAEWVATLARCRRGLAPGGEILLCHWQWPTQGVPLDGVLVHEQARTALDLPLRSRTDEQDVCVEVWGGPVSVATEEGRR